jgi:hypothetical protein
MTIKYIFSDILSVAYSASLSIEKCDYTCFSDNLSFFLRDTQTSPQKFANDLRLSRTTVEHWISGKNLPVNAMKVPILRYIVKTCIKLAYDITTEDDRKKKSEEFWNTLKTASESIESVLDRK